MLINIEIVRESKSGRGREREREGERGRERESGVARQTLIVKSDSLSYPKHSTDQV
jgi:hypothetical protein